MSNAIDIVENHKKAEKILKEAPDVLKALDKSYIFNTYSSREFPKFDRNEFQLGFLLGSGGFSNVYEINEIHLHSENTSTNAANENEKAEDTMSDHHHHDHYDVDTARMIMQKSNLRNGLARYAIKQLRLPKETEESEMPNALNVIDQARGAVDLAIEIKFLSTIWHPNIIKMRGYSNTERVSTESFLVLDRLFGTLDDKIEAWAKSSVQMQGCCSGFFLSPRNDPIAVQLLKDRLLVAYDLSSAIVYLHERRLLYRDLKPENIGFDVRGDVKLFDFGLMRSLEKADKVPNGYGYNLSVRTGSIPYMAPEIALGKAYDTKADVFSFSMLLWEIVGLEWAFNGFDTREYFAQVCARNLRLPLKRFWPSIVKTIIREGWSPSPEQRPTMKRIGTLLRGELRDLSNDLAVVDRTQHMLNKSRNSLRGILDKSAANRRRRVEPGVSTSRHKQGLITGSKSRRDSFVGGNTTST